MQRITAAPEPLGEDLARRQRRYLVQMGIRVVCFVLAIVTWSHAPRFVSLVLVVAAVVLPYVAVLLANAGRERRDELDPFVELREIGPGGRPSQLGGTPDEPAGGRS